MSAMEEYITEALKQGYIRKSHSLLSASLFFIEKKDGGLQPCIDYHGLKAVTVWYSHPLPLIFPEVGEFVVVYLDDILIYSKNITEHVRHVHTVLHCLLAHDLYVKAENCELHKTEIAFLSYRIGLGGVVMDDRKVCVVTEWPVPKAVKELQRFLGFANFRRFINNCSTVAAPLTSLLKGKPKTIWFTPETRTSFNNLKERFVSVPVLRLPDPTEEPLEASTSG